MKKSRQEIQKEIDGAASIRDLVEDYYDMLLASNMSFEEDSIRILFESIKENLTIIGDRYLAYQCVPYRYFLAYQVAVKLFLSLDPDYENKVTTPEIIVLCNVLLNLNGEVEDFLDDMAEDIAENEEFKALKIHRFDEIKREKEHLKSKQV